MVIDKKNKAYGNLNNEISQLSKWPTNMTIANTNNNNNKEKKNNNKTIKLTHTHTPASPSLLLTCFQFERRLGWSLSQRTFFLSSLSLAQSFVKAAHTSLCSPIVAFFSSLQSQSQSARPIVCVSLFYSKIHEYCSINDSVLATWHIQIKYEISKSNF